jgi:hypothetical protein
MKICWENFQQRWEIMRALRGADVLASVELSSRPFKTRNWGFKPRPDLKVLDWHIAEGRVGEVLFKPAQPQLPPAADSTTAQSPAAAQQNAQPASPPASQPPKGQVTFLPPVKPVTRSEEMRDDIPW